MLPSIVMRRMTVLAIVTLLISAGSRAQQAAGPAGAPTKAAPEVGSQAPADPKSEALLAIYQIDLDPSGTAFALGKPVLEGGAYVFKAWPERTMVRLDPSKVKKITQRTKDLDHEVVYQIDLVPTGRMIARENPTLKGTTYVFKTWRDGTLMSMRQADIRKITKVTGIAAFRIQQEERGAALNADLPMQGGGNVRVIPAAEPAPAAQAAPPPAQGNWTYQGQPGVTDAYAPPSAVVDSPGDVPKAAPQPTPQPR